jgi:hypothetical protein
VLRSTLVFGTLSATAALVACSALALGPGPAWAGELLSVRADDGRVLQGEVDARTNKQLLWLRLGSPQVVVCSSIQWDRVLSARYKDRLLSAAELAGLAEGLKSEPAEEMPSTYAAGQIDTARREPLPARSKVCSLAIEAAVANWDGDVETDGLQIRVLPLAADGSITAVDGMISIRLIGQRVRGRAGQEVFEELGRWTQRIRRSDCGPWGAVYQLAFWKVHPDFDLEYAADGLVHGQLGVPGQGNFEASVPVQLRTYFPLRDQLQLQSQTRFLPQERTGWRNR